MGVAHQYRPEIDGLRAIAVVPVVLFHAGFEVFQGGYVGVDIFFVISGYLITSIIIGDLDRGRFSLLDFYERRARRILPALFVVTAVCIPFAWRWLLPQEMKEFAQSILAVALFSSNILFHKQSNYFDTAAELKPLLHTWSLAVEEQYYILFPLLLMLIWRLGRSWVFYTSAAIALGSLALAQMQSVANPSAAFYLLPARGWEILFGALLALRRDVLTQWRRPRWVDEGFAFVGLALIAFSIFNYDSDTPFPGIFALPPTVGAALVIAFARNGNLMQRFLANRFFVGIGLISYSAYLWHQPLFAFARNVVSLKPQMGLMGSLALLSFGLAYLTWRFVENPFRDKQIFLRKFIFIFSGVGLAVFISVGAVGAVNKGFPSRFDLEALYAGDVGHLEFHKVVAEKYYRCLPQGIADQALSWEGYLRCMQSKNQPQADVALIGDSHAEHLFLGLAEALDNKNVVFYIKNSAPYVSNSEFADIYRHVLASDTIRTVIFAMQWVARMGAKPETFPLEEELRETLETLQKAGKVIYLIDDVPRFNAAADRCKYGFKGVVHGAACTVRQSEIERYERVYVPALKSVASSLSGVKLLHLRDLFCDGKTCSMVKNGVLMFRDNNHLNIPGSEFVGRYIYENFPELNR